MEYYGTGEAYLPILEALGHLCRGPGGERLVTLLRQHAPTWLVHMPWLLTERDRQHLREALQGVTQERMLRECADVVDTLTATTALLLVFEDLQWSDHATLDLLARLARRQTPAHLLVVGTYRPVEMMVRHHPLRTVVQDLQRQGHARELPLALLNAEAVAAYLAARFPQQRFPATLAPWLYQRTDGQPLFLVTLVQALVARGVLYEHEGCWTAQAGLATLPLVVPESLRQLLEYQITRLPPEAQRLLEVASVLGGEFSVASVAAGLAEDPVAVEECCDQLARQGQFLAASPLFKRPDGTPVALYHFTHSLYPSVLTDRVSAARGLRLHQRLGEWLEQTYGAHAGVIETQMAHHFEEARDYPRAIEHLRRAAERDVRRWAHQEAAARLTHAVALVDRLPPADGAAVYPVLLDLLGHVYRALGDLAGTVQTCETLAAWARERGEIGWEASAVLHRATVLAWVDTEDSRAASMERKLSGIGVVDQKLGALLYRRQLKRPRTIG